MPLIVLDRDWRLLARESVQGVQPVHTAENRAYVLYTSGSTGQPRGVQIPHRALLNFLLAMTQRLQFTPTDSVLALTTLSFDIAGLELYLPLLSGAGVLLRPARRSWTVSNYSNRWSVCSRPSCKPPRSPGVNSWRPG